MESLFHLVFETIRITILAFLYGYVIWIVLAKIFKITSVQKTYVSSVLFFGLFIWRFTYWRNNGWGDFGRVPLNSDYEVMMIDFWYADIKNMTDENGLTNGMEKLYLENGILYGKTESEFILFHLDSGTLTSGLSETEFINKKGVIEKLVAPDRFHGDYWGWKILFF